MPQRGLSIPCTSHVNHAEGMQTIFVGLSKCHSFFSIKGGGSKYSTEGLNIPQSV